jgi:hypothetical protein
MKKGMLPPHLIAGITVGIIVVGLSSVKVYQSLTNSGLTQLECQTNLGSWCSFCENAGWSTSHSMDTELSKCSSKYFGISSDCNIEGFCRGLLPQMGQGGGVTTTTSPGASTTTSTIGGITTTLPGSSTTSTTTTLVEKCSIGECLKFSTTSCNKYCNDKGMECKNKCGTSNLGVIYTDDKCNFVLMYVECDQSVGVGGGAYIRCCCCPTTTTSTTTTIPCGDQVLSDCLKVSDFESKNCAEYCYSIDLACRDDCGSLGELYIFSDCSGTTRNRKCDQDFRAVSSGFNEFICGCADPECDNDVICTEVCGGGICKNNKCYCEPNCNNDELFCSEGTDEKCWCNEKICYQNERCNYWGDEGTGYCTSDRNDCVESADCNEVCEELDYPCMCGEMHCSKGQYCYIDEEGTGYCKSSKPTECEAESIPSEPILDSTLCGINYHSAWWHYDSQYTTDDIVHRDFQLFQKNGINLVTILIQWVYMEPSDGIYRQKYMNDIKRVIEIADQHDIDCIIDFHTINLMPNWLPPKSLSETSTNRFVTNQKTRDSFFEFEKYVIQNVDHYDNVHSYHIFNEPYLGSLQWQFSSSRQEVLQFLQDLYNNAKLYTNKPCSIRYGTDSITASSQFNDDPMVWSSCDYITANYYIDEAWGSHSETRLRNIVEKAHNLGKKIMIGEFGRNTDDDLEQQTYMKKYVELFNDIDIDYIGAWIWRADTKVNNEPDAPVGGGYNLAADLNGNPRPAFYELSGCGNEEEFKTLSMDIGLYSSSRVVDVYTSGIDYRDGETIGQYLDIYNSAGTWVNDAISGIHQTDAKIICYFNYAAMTPNGAGYVDDITGHPFYVGGEYAGNHDDWLLYSISGDPVVANNWDVNFIMNSGKDPWRAYTDYWTEQRMIDGYDGMFMDNGFTSRINLWHMNAVPVNPDTGEEFSTEEWVMGKVDHVNYIKSQHPDKIFIANGLWNGKLYYDDYDWYVYVLENMEIDGVFSEGVFSNIDGVMEEDSNWVKSINMIEEVQDIWLSKGPDKIAIWHSQVNNAVNGAKSTNQIYGLGLSPDQVAKYYFCSILMGVSDPEGNYLSANNYAINDPDLHALLDLDLGLPMGSYSEIDNTGVYKREYTSVIVYVNPSRYTKVADGINFEPFSGEIIIK